jgi:hypothetical protein
MQSGNGRTGFVALVLVALTGSLAGCASDRTAHGFEHPKHHHTWSFLAKLPAADRAKLHTAHEIAMRDPKVRAAREQRNRANKKYHAALRAAMLKADPSLQPILGRIDQHKKDSR